MSPFVRMSVSHFTGRLNSHSYVASVDLDAGTGPTTIHTKYTQLNAVGCMLGLKEECMHPIRIANLTPTQLTELDDLYRTTRDLRLHTRTQMVLLAAEQQVTAAQIAGIVRASEETVRRWLTRYRSDGIAGLRDGPRPGAPGKVTAVYREQLLAAVRQRPRSLELPFSLWTLRR